MEPGIGEVTSRLDEALERLGRHREPYDAADAVLLATKAGVWYENRMNYRRAAEIYHRASETLMAADHDSGTLRSYIEYFAEHEKRALLWDRLLRSQN